MAPFAGYNDFDDCVRQNADKDDPEGYCAAIKRDVEGMGALSEDESEHAERYDGDLDAGDRTMMAAERVLAEFRNPGDIERLKTDDGQVRYNNIMLLAPGEWTDAGSQQTVDYNGEAIRRSAENWISLDAVKSSVPDWQTLSNDERARKLDDLGETVRIDRAPINFLHGPAMYGAESLDAVGEIPVDSITVDDQSRMYGDLIFHGDTPQSETAIELMDEVLEASQSEQVETPPVGPSVEIPADRVEQEGNTLKLQEAWFSATGIVLNPASRPVELGMQARERAVAMSAAVAPTGGAVLRAAERTLQDWSEIETGDYPDAAVENAQMALDAREETGNPNDCGTDVGWARANQLVNGETLSPDVVSRMAQFERHEDNAEQGAEGRADCGWMMWKAWGGTEGIEWAQQKVDAAEAAASERANASEGESTNPLPRHRHIMGDPTDFDPSDLNDEELARTLQTMQEDMAAIERALQSDAELQTTDDLIAEYLDAGGDLSDPVSDMAEFVSAETDADLDAIQPLLDDYLDAADAESLDETPVEDLQSYVDEAWDDVNDGEEGEGEEAEGDEEPDEATMQELESLKQSLGEFASHMSEIKEMLAAHEERVADLEGLERRLTELEEEPQPRSLTVDDPDEFVDADDAGGSGEHEDVLMR